MRKTLIGTMFLGLIISLIFGNSLFAAEKNLRIAMLLWRGETKAEQGFKTRLKELGYLVEYTLFNSEQDRKKLRHILNNEIAHRLDDFDYIYTFGTTVSKMTKVYIDNKVPQLFNIVFGPLESKVVCSMEKRRANICGATHRIPVSVQIKAVSEIIQFKRLGFLFNPREKNTLIQRNKIYNVADKLGFEVVDLRSPPALEMLQKNLQRIIDKSIVVDVVYLPSDSFMISSAELIGSQLRVAKVMSIGTIKTFIVKGALIGVVPDYYKVGEAVARIVDRNQKGEALKDIPVQQIYKTKEPVLMINRTTSNILKFHIPDALLKKAIIVD